MAFGLNRAEVIGRLGADVTINHLASGGRVANLSIATDESYIDKQTGERVDRTEWHRVVTFQNGLVDMFEKHARKGRLVYVAGKLQTRRWKKDGEDSDRFSTEILLVPVGASSSWISPPATAPRRRPARRPRPPRPVPPIRPTRTTSRFRRPPPTRSLWGRFRVTADAGPAPFLQSIRRQTVRAARPRFARAAPPHRQEAEAGFRPWRRAEAAREPTARNGG